MGKYMRKAKITGEVAVMEVSPQSSLGVRTRARTLALQRTSSPTQVPSPAAAGPESGSYIQLRSRRLEKPLAAPSRPAGTCEGGPKPGDTEKVAPRPRSPRLGAVASSVNSGSAVGSASAARACSRKGGWEEQVSEASSVGNDGAEASFAENVLESEGSERNVRETTPCSFIRDLEAIGTPGSTTRQRPVPSRRTQSISRRNILTSDEMEGFFVGPEKLQQSIFKEKYNFDPVNDCPLPGRYEWVKLDS